ncbi:MAG: helix-turn-helix transcriptional regulator [Bacilli bacterium]|nr:helix-turn-helix transcriptional regulator [Bacilli bacterium]
MIYVNLDKMMRLKGIGLVKLAERVGITTANMSLLKNGKVKGIRFETLSKICEILQCQPGEILEYRDNEHAK